MSGRHEGRLFFIFTPDTQRAVSGRLVAQAQTRQASHLYPGIQSICFYFASSLRSRLHAQQFSWSCHMELRANKLALSSAWTACHHASLYGIVFCDKYNDVVLVLLYYFSVWDICMCDFIFIIQLLVNATPRIVAYCSEWVEPINSAASRITPNVLGERVGWFTWFNIPKRRRLWDAAVGASG